MEQHARNKVNAQEVHRRAMREYFVAAKEEMQSGEFSSSSKRTATTLSQAEEIVPK
jgi:glutaredoxin 2